jgi:hypothetical protein
MQVMPTPSDLTPAVPEPGADLVPADVAAAVVAWLQEADDVGQVNDARLRLEAWEGYLARQSQRSTEMVAACRLAEVRIGELLGPAEMGRPTVSFIAMKLFSHQQRHQFRRMAEHSEAITPVIEAGASRRKVMTKICQIEREHTPAQEGDLDDVLDGPVTLLHGDFRERLKHLPPESVDLIVTDPPYPKDDLPLWSDLGALARRVLGPRGILFAWSGQLFLPEVIRRLEDAGLRYGWTFCLRLPGSNSRIMGRHIIQHWKPVVAFTVGTWPSGEWGGDMLTSPEADDAEYRWRQTVPPAVELIERFSPPTGLVVDPMMGHGTFGVAARQEGRRFLGVELDAERFDTAVDRLT